MAISGGTRRLLVTALLACSGGGVACENGGAEGDADGSGSDGETGGSTLGFAADIQPLFDDNCQGENADCHIAGGKYTTPELFVDGNSYDEIVGELATAPLLEQFTMSYVEPNDPANSYLLHKVKGTHTELFMDEELAGERMPCDEFVGSGLDIECAGNTMQLSEAEIQLIEDWIAEGAPE